MTTVEFELKDGHKLQQNFAGTFTDVFSRLNQVLIQSNCVIISGHLVAADQIKSLRPVKKTCHC